MDILQAMAIRDAKSMEVFADGDPSFVWGEWREWRRACQEAGETLPPADFKKRGVISPPEFPDHA